MGVIFVILTSSSSEASVWLVIKPSKKFTYIYIHRKEIISNNFYVYINTYSVLYWYQMWIHVYIYTELCLQNVFRIHIHTSMPSHWLWDLRLGLLRLWDLGLLVGVSWCGSLGRRHVVCLRSKRMPSGQHWDLYIYIRKHVEKHMAEKKIRVTSN